MHVQVCPRVIFPDGFDDRAAFELADKGWLRAQVEMKDGSRLPVYFSDPFRLRQDLEERVKLGRSYLAEPGLIVLPEVTVGAIEATVQALSEQGFFAYLKPCQAEERVAARQNDS